MSADCSLSKRYVHRRSNGSRSCSSKNFTSWPSFLLIKYICLTTRTNTDATKKKHVNYLRGRMCVCVAGIKRLHMRCACRCVPTAGLTCKWQQQRHFTQPEGEGSVLRSLHCFRNCGHNKFAFCDIFVECMRLLVLLQQRDEVANLLSKPNWLNAKLRFHSCKQFRNCIPFSVIFLGVICLLSLSITNCIRHLLQLLQKSALNAV